MKIKLGTSDLTKALKDIKGTVPDRPTHPILSHIMFSQKDNIATLQSCDLTAVTSVVIPTQGEDIEFCIPYDLLVKSLIGLEGDLTFDVSEDLNFMTIKNGRKTRKLPLQPSDEFPNFEASLDKGDFKKVTINTDDSDFLVLLKTLSSFVSTDDTKQILTCINLNGSRMAATDGHRAVRCQTGLGIEGDFSIPYKVAKELTKLSGEITLTLSKGFVKAESSLLSYVGRLMVGDYPKIDPLFPKDYTNQLTLHSPKPLILSVTALNTFTQNKGNNLLLLSEKDGEVFLSGVSDITEGKDFIDCGTDAKEFRLGFNSVYLKAALSVQKGNTIIQFNDARSPVVFTSDGPLEALVMPVQIRA